MTTHMTEIEIDAELDRIKRKFKERSPHNTRSTTARLAKPYAWPDPASIPKREFLYGRHYIRGAVGATIAAGGRAKTTHGLTEAIGMAAGRSLITGQTQEPLRAWYINGEEPQDELDRRVAAICQHYGIKPTDCGDRLYVQSVRDKPLRLATMDKHSAKLDRNLLGEVEAAVVERSIDCVMLDPFISFHSVRESDNGDMDLLLKEGLGGIAQRTRAAIEIFHHPGKPKPDQADTTVEDGRGASAILWAVRSARVMNFMAPEEAKQFGIAEESRRLHIRIANGKANMGPLGKAEWLKIVVENIPNGDEIACVISWKPPDPFEGVSTSDVEWCRQLAQTGAHRWDVRSEDWIGYPLAERLNIKVKFRGDNAKADIARLKAILKKWLANNVFALETREDKSRRKREFVVPVFATDAPPTAPQTSLDDDDLDA
jgi:hypothetical protein